MNKRPITYGVKGAYQPVQGVVCWTVVDQLVEQTIAVRAKMHRFAPMLEELRAKFEDLRGKR